MPIGPAKTTGGLSGLYPQQTVTGFTTAKQKRLFYSRREQALLREVQIQAGFGTLEAGTVMATESSTGYLVPYIPDTITLDTDVGRAWLLNDCDTASTFRLSKKDSYKIYEGATIVLTDTDGSYEEATVSDIDRTTYDQWAVVTLSGAISGAFTTAKKANCYVKSGASGKRSTATYILDQGVYTGGDPWQGEDEYENVTAGGVGAQGSVVISNASLYQDAVVGMDSQAQTDLGNITDDSPYYHLT